jgi:hypothetical protein
VCREGEREREREKENERGKERASARCGVEKILIMPIENKE